MKQQAIILVGKSGSGKDTLAAELTNRYRLPRNVTYTTRPMRKGEVDGVHYHFISPKTFVRYEKQGFFAETATYQATFGTCQYASSRDSYQQPSVTILTPSGIRSVLASLPPEKAPIVVYLKADEALLQKRLEARGDKVDEIERRLAADAVMMQDVEELADIVLPIDERMSPSFLAQMLFHDIAHPHEILPWDPHAQFTDLPYEVRDTREHPSNSLEGWIDTLEKQTIKEIANRFYAAPEDVTMDHLASFASPSTMLGRFLRGELTFVCQKDTDGGCTLLPWVVDDTTGEKASFAEIRKELALLPLNCDVITKEEKFMPSNTGRPRDEWEEPCTVSEHMQIDFTLNDYFSLEDLTPALQMHFDAQELSFLEPQNNASSSMEAPCEALDGIETVSAKAPMKVKGMSQRAR